MKRLFILAGANGSGKSTIAKVLLPSEKIDYVNPDDIARELNPQNFTSVKIAAGREALRRIDDLIIRNKSFAIESTLSGLAYVKTIERVKRAGYTTIVDVRRRYVRSKRNFLDVYASLVDHWMLYYNGGSDLSLVAHGNGSVNVLSQERFSAFKEDLC